MRERGNPVRNLKNCALWKAQLFTNTVTPIPITTPDQPPLKCDWQPYQPYPHGFTTLKIRKYTLRLQDGGGNFSKQKEGKINGYSSKN